MKRKEIAQFIDARRREREAKVDAATEEELKELAKKQFARLKELTETVKKVAPYLLRAYRRRYESGDKSALIYALLFAVRLPEPIPKWLVNAFTDATTTVLSHEVRSWDDVFGQPLPKGAQLDSARLRSELEFPVLREVQKHRDARENIDHLMFEAIAESLSTKKYRIGATLISEIYADLRKKGWFRE